MKNSLDEALHAVALCQTADAAGVAVLMGVPAGDAESVLAEGIERGDLQEIRGTIVVSEEGEARLADVYEDEYREARADDGLAKAFDGFEQLNRQVLALMTQWQTVEVDGQRVPNDHADSEYDARVVAQIGTLHDRLERVLAPFVAVEPRVGRICGLLADALERAERGDHEYVSAVTIDSYHTVWFRLHEDFLRIMGRERDE